MGYKDASEIPIDYKYPLSLYRVYILISFLILGIIHKKVHKLDIYYPLCLSDYNPPKITSLTTPAAIHLLMQRLNEIM